jgi:hypothetical protein
MKQFLIQSTNYNYSLHQQNIFDFSSLLIERCIHCNSAYVPALHFYVTEIIYLPVGREVPKAREPLTLNQNHLYSVLRKYYALLA